MKQWPAVLLLCFCASGAAAQEPDGFQPKLGSKETPPPPPQATMGQLLSQGYQIKAAAPSGSKFVVFLQKDRSGYACEMQSLTTSRCGTLN